MRGPTIGIVPQVDMLRHPGAVWAKQVRAATVVLGRDLAGFVAIVTSKTLAGASAGVKAVRGAKAANGALVPFAFDSIVPRITH